MNIRRISPEEYAATKNRTTIDLRTAAECESEYIAGCLALPVQELNQQSFERVLHTAKHNGEAIHLLCQSGKRAEVAVSKLEGLTQYELVIIEGGLNALKQAGHPTLQGGRKTISLERQVRIAAGGLVFLGAVLTATVHINFIALPALVGAGLMFAGITDTCGMAMLLARMPWNAAKLA